MHPLGRPVGVALFFAGSVARPIVTGASSTAVSGTDGVLVAPDMPVVLPIQLCVRKSDIPISPTNTRTKKIDFTVGLLI
ncbi:MAG: hypothetical protein C4294_19705 [Nitrospiraceae bacterium]